MALSTSDAVILGLVALGSYMALKVISNFSKIEDARDAHDAKVDRERKRRRNPRHKRQVA